MLPNHAQDSVISKVCEEGPEQSGQGCSDPSLHSYPLRPVRQVGFANVPRTISDYDPVVCLAEKGELPARTPDPKPPYTAVRYRAGILSENLMIPWCNLDSDCPMLRGRRCNRRKSDIS